MDFRLLIYFPFLTLFSCNLVINNLQRHISLENQNVQITLNFELNTKNKENIFVIVIDKNHVEHLSFVTGKYKDNNKIQELDFKNNAFNKPEKFEAKLKNAFQSNTVYNVEVVITYSKILKPYPLEIHQENQHLVLFSTNIYVKSPYAIKSQTTTFTLPSRVVESFTNLPGSNHEGNRIRYGPYDNVDKNSEELVEVHFPIKFPLVAASKVERLIEVSHWGNVAIEENIELYHYGAKVNSFSRLKYSSLGPGPSAFPTFVTILPSSAKDIYYRDEIGNISTSLVSKKKSHTYLNLFPRFPLYGGWKTQYKVGYNLPSFRFLFHHGDDFLLKIPIIDQIFKNLFVEEALVKIVLPEGAKNIKVETSIPVEQDAPSLYYSFLDTVGRPTVTLRKKALVDANIKNIEVTYTFSKYMMIQEPVLLMSALLFLFFIAIIYTRLDFSLENQENMDNKLKMAALSDEIRTLQSKRFDLYNQWIDALKAYKQSKNTSKFNNSKKDIEAKLKTLSKSISDFTLKIKDVSNECADKISELQKIDKILKDEMNILTLNVEKVHSGKMSKQQFTEHEKSLLSSKEENIDKCERILAYL